MIKKLAIPAVALLFVLGSCYNDNKQDLYPSFGPCDTTNITYNNYVKTVMDQSCAVAPCHDAASHQGTYTLDNYVQVKAAAQNTVKGPEGLLLGSIRHSAGYFSMPDGRPKLDDCTIAKISAWIHSGAPE